MNDNKATVFHTIMKIPNLDKIINLIYSIVNNPYEKYVNNKIIYPRSGYCLFSPLCGFKRDFIVTARIWEVIHLLKTNREVKKRTELRQSTACRNIFLLWLNGLRSQTGIMIQHSVSCGEAPNSPSIIINLYISLEHDSFNTVWFSWIRSEICGDILLSWEEDHVLSLAYL